MQAPQQSFDYQGHHVEVAITKVADRWHWSYRIDDSSPYELNDTAESSQSRALQYACADARNRIDNLAHRNGQASGKA